MSMTCYFSSSTVFFVKTNVHHFLEGKLLCHFLVLFICFKFLQISGSICLTTPTQTKNSLGFLLCELMNRMKQRWCITCLVGWLGRNTLLVGSSYPLHCYQCGTSEGRNEAQQFACEPLSWARAHGEVNKKDEK